MIEIRVTGANAQEALEQMTGLIAGALPTDTSWKPVEFPPDPKAQTKSKPEETKAPEKPKAQAKPKPEEAKDPEKPEPASDTVDKATLQKKMKQLLDSGHRDELFTIFKEHGAKKLSEVDSSQYGVIYDQLEAIK